MFHTWTWQLFGSWKISPAQCPKTRWLAEEMHRSFLCMLLGSQKSLGRRIMEIYGDTCFGYHPWKQKHGSLSLGMAWEMMILVSGQAIRCTINFGMFTFNSSRIFSPPIQLGEFLTFSMVLHFLLKPKKIKSCRYFNHLLWRINHFHR